MQLYLLLFDHGDRLSNLFLHGSLEAFATWHIPACATERSSSLPKRASNKGLSTCDVHWFHDRFGKEVPQGGIGRFAGYNETITRSHLYFGFCMYPNSRPWQISLVSYMPWKDSEEYSPSFNLFGDVGGYHLSFINHWPPYPSRQSQCRYPGSPNDGMCVHLLRSCVGLLATQRVIRMNRFQAWPYQGIEPRSPVFTKWAFCYPVIDTLLLKDFFLYKEICTHEFMELVSHH